MSIGVSAPVIRRLQADLESAIPRHWAGGDAFRSAFFDALSFSFPAGEQFFIDSVKMGAERLQGAERERFDGELRGFIGQEATHRRIHERMNAQLEARGLVNVWAGRIAARRRKLEGVDARIWVGATAATEHFTAVFAEWLLTHPGLLAGVEPRLANVWLWHASEESEHRSVAFDLYRAAGGDERWRRRIFWRVTVDFALDLTLQTLSNLRRSGDLWRWATWASGARLLVGRGGLLRYLAPRWRAYLAPSFHPSHGDGGPAERWLADNADLAPPVAAR